MDTIVALATPLGRSGIGMIRISGPDALPIVRKLTDDPTFDPEPRYSNLKKLYSGGTEIEEALVVYFKAPSSYTAEDVIEISCHGSPVLLRQVIDICLKNGARLADAGEFTLRALSNGKLDLAQAEAIRDLIDANSVAMTRQAIRQLRGEFSHQLKPFKDELLDDIVVLESALEFVEDDLPETQSALIRERLEKLAAKLRKLSSTFSAGKLIREGIRVALVGRPNVGKSSLFNALIGQDSAIVTEIPGTTRDQLKESFTIETIPVSLIDTAGLRETVDTVESIGVARSKRAMADADVVVVVLDGSVELTGEDMEILAESSDLERIIAINKDDLFDSPLAEADLEGETVVIVSAKTGHGLKKLEEAVISPYQNEVSETSGFVVSDARHHDLLERCADEIEASIELLDQNMSEEIVLVGLHNAIRYLGEITGETTTEDMLTRVFETFCIGK
ncbi:MAG: tRNA uridine-5-carboxymethylaminomethyl(34) synthesis GTPase MnmE [Acidobacteriota bacterium]|nr:tRNA uridine-5-carboxymethylaminomethyl(34) synthesis GTPase MnmE [Acidobacteriota bacterium]MDH3530926.1 tRNA uridine-5-carboxymethylaminomethyl(34) synthesis GTPase MnmE [Acidobacteriota bacterium]